MASSAAIDSDAVKSFFRLKDDQIEVLQDFGIENLDDLSFLEEKDINETLKSSLNLMQRRKLSAFHKFVKNGGRVNVGATINDLEQIASGRISAGTALPSKEVPTPTDGSGITKQKKIANLQKGDDLKSKFRIKSSTIIQF